MSISFAIEARSGSARAARLMTQHGEIKSPFFMPVGTLAAVKGLTPAMLREAGAQIVLANTYHLALRPGEELVKEFGGVADFMGWHGPTLTDSGGFQVYSLADIRKVTDDGVRFRSHIDGAEFYLTPERAVEIQQALGPDMFMALDECPPGGSDHATVATSLKKTHEWAKRCKDAWTNRDSQSLFGIVQGGLHEDLRAESAGFLSELDLPGYAIGGVSVGEPAEEIDRIVQFTAPKLPDAKPRYLMGVGTPQDMLRAIGHGIDMFDCVMPTRHARHAQVFTDHGRVNLRNLKWRQDHGPIEEGCDCYTCRTVSLGYLRHLFVADELMGLVYATIHNIRYYLRLMERARAAILENRYESFRDQLLAQMG